MSALIPIDNEITAEIVEEYEFLDLIEMKVSPFLLSLQVGERTIKAYETNINYFIDWVKSQDIVIRSRNEILQYKSYLIEKKLKATTINAYLTAVRRFFSWLYDMDITGRDYSKGIKSIATDTEHKKDPLSDDQWQRLVDNLDLAKPIDMRDYLIMVLGANYGLRSIEISRLNRNDIIQVQDKWALNLWRKGYSEADKKPRPISNDFYELLMNFINDIVMDDTPIFTSLSNNACDSHSERLSTSGLRYAIRKRFREAGITSDRITFHSMRHYFATSLIRKGHSLLDVRNAMDHKSTTTTEIYVATASRFDNPIAFDLDLAKPTATKQ